MRNLHRELENKQLGGRLQFPPLIPISCLGLCHFLTEVKNKNGFEEERDSSRERSRLHEKLILG